MGNHVKENKVTLESSDLNVIEGMLNEMVALNLHTVITEVSCIAPVEKVVIDKFTSLIAPSIFKASAIE